MLRMSVNFPGFFTLLVRCCYVVEPSIQLPERCASDGWYQLFPWLYADPAEMYLGANHPRGKHLCCGMPPPLATGTLHVVIWGGKFFFWGAKNFFFTIPQKTKTWAGIWKTSRVIVLKLHGKNKHIPATVLPQLTYLPQIFHFVSVANKNRAKMWVEVDVFAVGMLRNTASKCAICVKSICHYLEVQYT